MTRPSGPHPTVDMVFNPGLPSVTSVSPVPSAFIFQASP
jgi:hypothetical protein